MEGIVGSLRCVSGPVFLGNSSLRRASRPSFPSTVARKAASPLTVKAIAAPFKPVEAEKEIASEEFVDRVSLVAVLATNSKFFNFPEEFPHRY